MGELRRDCSHGIPCDFPRVPVGALAGSPRNPWDLTGTRGMSRGMSRGKYMSIDSNGNRRDPTGTRRTFGGKQMSNSVIPVTRSGSGCIVDRIACIHMIPTRKSKGCQIGRLQKTKNKKMAPDDLHTLGNDPLPPLDATVQAFIPVIRACFDGADTTKQVVPDLRTLDQMTHSPHPDPVSVFIPVHIRACSLPSPVGRGDDTGINTPASSRRNSRTGEVGMRPSPWASITATISARLSGARIRPTLRRHLLGRANKKICSKSVACK